MNPIRPTLLTLLVVLGVASIGLAQDPPEPAEPAASEEAPPPAAKAPSTEAPASALSADPIVICRSVEDRTPSGEGISFPSDAGQLYCFTNIRGAKDPVQIYHRWYVGDRLATEIPIQVKAATWRCWSVKSILPSWSGTCRVDVATDAGDVIATTSFTLEPVASAE